MHLKSVSIVILGIKFWKVGSRKLFATTDIKGKRKRKRRSSTPDSDDDKNLKIIHKLDIVHSKVSQILEVNNHLPLPFGFSSILYDIFKCSICLVSPITPPAIVGKCCKRIVGCQKCVDEWYQGDDRMLKRCPLCQGERGFADTMILLGIDDFLLAVANVAGSPERPQQVPHPPVRVEIPSDTSD